MRTELVRYGYEQLTVASLGSLGAALVMAIIAGRAGWEARISLWLCMHGVVSFGALGAGVAYRAGRWSGAPTQALWLRRALSLSFGMVWALGGVWWSVPTEESGLAMLLCAAGLVAAASSTSSADPPGLYLFTVPTLAPWLVLALPDRGWLTVLLLVYLAAITLVSYRSQRLLKTSLALRSENAQLLARAVAEREVAENAQLRAEIVVASRSRFLAAASHDLRQPVQALSLFADVLQHQPDESRRAQAISAVGRTAQVLNEMLESLQDVSRLDTGMVTAVPRSVALRRLLDDTALGLKADAEAHDVALCRAGPECYVQADPALLTRVAQNLVLNALRHGGGGRVLLAVRRRRDHCLLQVWDQGPGIAPEDERRIFEEFVQLANPERDRQKGLGLGLSMVQRICDLNGWPLSLRTRVGRGSVFTVRLPRAVFPSAPPEGRELPPPHWAA